MFKCKQPSFFQTINTFSRLNVNVTICFDDEISVLLEDLRRDERDMDSCVLSIIHGGTKKEILDIKGAVSGPFSGIGDGTVEMDFCGEHGDCS